MALAQLPEGLLHKILSAACQYRDWQNRKWQTRDRYVLPGVCKEFNKVMLPSPDALRPQLSQGSLKKAAGTTLSTALLQLACDNQPLLSSQARFASLSRC